MSQAALPPAHQNLGKVKYLIRYLAGIHDIRSKDKKRDCQQNKVIVHLTGKNFHHHTGVHTFHSQIERGGYNHSYGYRHPDDKTHHQQTKGNHHGMAHTAFPPFRNSL